MSGVSSLLDSGFALGQERHKMILQSSCGLLLDGTKYQSFIAGIRIDHSMRVGLSGFSTVKLPFFQPL